MENIFLAFCFQIVITFLHNRTYFLFGPSYYVAVCLCACVDI